MNLRSLYLYYNNNIKMEVIMPNQDGTGPQGDGPRTGRGLGNCGGDSNNSGSGRGAGRGRGRNSGKGRGRGRRN